jgi:lysophospholipase L1-like esterase
VKQAFTFLSAILISTLCFSQTTQRATTTRPTGPARWEPDIAKFEAEDAKTPPPANPVLFVGSSSIRLWKVNEAFPNLPVLNRGFGGSDIPAVVYFAPRVVTRYKPKTIVFYSGDNDIAAGRSAEQVAEDFAELLAIVRKELPQTKLIVVGIKPSIARWKMIGAMRETNKRIKAMLDATPGAVLIDVEPDMLGPDGKPRAELFRDDGLHMNDKGYAIWNRLLEPYLK